MTDQVKSLTVAVDGNGENVMDAPKTATDNTRPTRFVSASRYWA